MTSGLVPPWRISIDVGGTFTDAVIVDSAGTLRSYKSLSQPDNPARGVLDCLQRAAASLGLALEALVADCSHFVHGSTVATNTLLEHSGAKVGLLVTEGFRDALEIRRGARSNPFDHRSPYPPVLVPRYLRLPVRERIDRDGRVIEPLDEASVRAAVGEFRREGVANVAICLLNSYRNGAHELQAERLVRSIAPEMWVTVSSRLVPLAGEYERASTAVVDAYVASKLVSYLQELDAALAHRRLRFPLLLVKSNGGVGTVADVVRMPSTLCLSGPAAVVGALRHLGEAAGTGDLISVEIGGTSCDVVLMAGGRVAVADSLSIGGYDTALPSVDIHTIGAGGGSIAAVDRAGVLCVGPRGAGARPGPAAYGLGGTEPTVTDAQLVLGRLRAGAFSGGGLSLDAELAERAIRTRVAEPLGMDVRQAAAGIVRVAEQHILHAVSLMSVERGLDPRRFTLVAGGGAGSLHCAAVGRMLGCRQVYVPRLGGVLCALGMQYSDLRQDTVRTFGRRLSAQSLADAAALFESLTAEARASLASQGKQDGEIRTERELDLRYAGQQWHVRVPLAAAAGETAVRELFEERHDRLYGHRQPHSEVEIVKCRLIATGIVTPPPSRPFASAATAPMPVQTRPVYVDEVRGVQPVPVYAGADLEPGARLRGPLVIEEATHTLFAGAGDNVSVDAHRNYLVRFGAPED